MHITMNERILYYILLCFAQSCGLVAIILIIYTLDHYYQISWSHFKFSFHPLMMILGMVYIHGTSLSAFRALNNFEKIYVKIFHAAAHTTVFIFSVVGLTAAFDSMSRHLTSFHSWIGIITMVLFTAQWFFSFLIYLFPKASDTIRSTFMPYHRACGLLIFTLACITALTGLVRFLNTDNVPLNVWIPLLVLFFGTTTVIITMLPIFKRENIYD